MENGLHRPLHFDVTRYVLMGEAKSRVRKKVRNVRLISGHQIVQTKYVPALFQHQFAEMRAQESSTTCDYRTQIRFLRRKNFSNKPLLSSKKPSAGTAPSLLILSLHCFAQRKQPTWWTLRSGEIFQLVRCSSGGSRKSRCVIGHDSPAFFEFPKIEREDSRRPVLFSF